MGGGLGDSGTGGRCQCLPQGGEGLPRTPPSSLAVQFPDSIRAAAPPCSEKLQHKPAFWQDAHMKPFSFFHVKTHQVFLRSARPSKPLRGQGTRKGLVLHPGATRAVAAGNGEGRRKVQETHGAHAGEAVRRVTSRPSQTLQGANSLRNPKSLTPPLRAGKVTCNAA